MGFSRLMIDDTYFDDSTYGHFVDCVVVLWLQLNQNRASPADSVKGLSMIGPA